MIDRRHALLVGVAALLLGLIGGPRRGGGPEDHTQGIGRTPGRVSDGPGGRKHGQKARRGDGRTAQHSDVCVNAARRREGGDRAGASRRIAARPGQRRHLGPRGRRPQRVQPAVSVSRQPLIWRRSSTGRSARNCSTKSPAIPIRASSGSPGWMPARAASTTPRGRSRASTTSRGSKCALWATRCSST